MSIFHTNWYRTIAALSFILVGAGLARFAFGAWIPVMLRDHWVSIHGAGYIGTAISFGAFIGLLCTHRLALLLGQERLVRISIIIAVVVLAAQIWAPGHEQDATVAPKLDSFAFWWLMALRFICGIIAAVSIIVTPAFVIKGIATKNQPILIGIAIAGGGIGAVIASLLMPWATTVIYGPAGGATMIAVLALIFGLIAWPAFKTAADAKQVAQQSEVPGKQLLHLPLILIIIGMFLLFFGLMPVAVYASAYLNLERGLSTADSAVVFSIFGVGAALGGPVLGSVLARFLGGRIAAVISAALGIAAMLAFLFPIPVIWVIIAVGIVGLIFMGHVSLTSGRVFRYAGANGRLKAWGWCGVAMGLGSVVGTFVSSALVQALGHEEGFRWTFIIGLASMILILITHGLANAKPVITEEPAAT